MAATNLVQQRILVVDTNERLRRDLRVFLQKHRSNWQVEDASTSKDMIQAAMAAKPHVVLVDVSILKEDGLAILTYLRSCLPTALIVIMTQSDEDEYRMVARDVGALTCISKKRLFAGLITTLESALAATDRSWPSTCYTTSSPISTSPSPMFESIDIANASVPLQWHPKGWREWFSGVLTFGAALLHGAPIDASPHTDYWRYLQASMLFLAALLLAAMITGQFNSSGQAPKLVLAFVSTVFAIAQVRHIRRLSSKKKTSITNTSQFKARHHERAYASKTNR